jgi:hypothetical protein
MNGACFVKVKSELPAICSDSYIAFTYILSFIFEVFSILRLPMEQFITLTKTLDNVFFYDMSMPCPRRRKRGPSSTRNGAKDAEFAWSFVPRMPWRLMKWKGPSLPTLKIVTGAGCVNFDALISQSN